MQSICNMSWKIIFTCIALTWIVDVHCMSEMSRKINPHQKTLCQAIQHKDAKWVQESLLSANPNFECDIRWFTDPNNAQEHFHYIPEITTPFTQAIRGGSFEIIELVLKKLMNNRSQEIAYLDYPIQKVIELKDTGPNHEAKIISIIDLLVQYGCTVNSYSSPDDFPLYLALDHDLPRVAECLIKKGANKEFALRNACRWYFHYDVMEKNASICRWLIRHGADIYKKEYGLANSAFRIHDEFCVPNPHLEHSTEYIQAFQRLRLILLDEESWPKWTIARARNLLSCCCSPKEKKIVRKIDQ